MQAEKKIFKIDRNHKGFFGDSKTRTRNLIILISPFFVLMCLFIVLTITSAKSLVSSVSSSGSTSTSNANEIEGMNIQLRDNATDLQKDLFAKLKQAYIDGDDEEAARLTAESFIADFYTWTNKYGSYDVGGVLYCADRTNAELFGRDTFYKYVSYYIEKYGSENLLEVTSISSEGGFVNDSKYTIEESGKSYNQYYFDVHWEYANHTGFTEKEFCNYQYVIVVKSDTGRFEVVETNG